VNRHYLKTAASDRLARLAVPYLQSARWLGEPTPEDEGYLEQVVPIAAASVDRLEQVPQRLAFLFDYDAQRALADPEVRREAEASRDVLAALAEIVAAREPMIDKATFRAMTVLVREKTGQKGKALLHPIRLALTGEPEGVELDLAVPAIERGALLDASRLRRIPSAAVRAGEFVRALEGTPPTRSA
jgi:glutamyl/glutaminyl-tRNA synthetase